jgi:hypothetical protein
MTDTTVTATVHITLPVTDGHAHLPRPTVEHGGLDPVPAGCCVLLDVGNAHHISGHTARTLAPVLAKAHHVDVIGTHAPTLKGIRSAIHRAIKDHR